MIRPTFKRALFWMLLVAAAAVSIWWTLEMPYRPGAVLEVVPPHALWVSRHDRPAERWPDWSRNGAVRAAAAEMGLDLARVERLLEEEPRLRTWFERLGRREAVLAYVPAVPPSGEPAFILSCWAGGYSQRLRWFMTLTGRKPAPGSDKTHPFWLVETDGLPDDLQLAVGVREGVLALVISREAGDAMRLCLDAADHLRARPFRFDPEGTAPDRAWLRLGDGEEWRVAVRELTPDRIRLTARRERGWSEELTAPAAGDPAVLARLLEKADGSITAPWSAIRNALLPRAGDWIGPADALVREVGGGAQVRVVVAAYGGDYGARLRSVVGGDEESPIRGLRMPAFVAAVPVANPDSVGAAVGRCLDRLNRIKPYGLVVRPAGVCYGYTVTAVEGTRGEGYRDFAPSEQVAFTEAGGWLLIGSHLGAMERLLPSVPHGPAGRGEAWPGVTLAFDGPALNATMGKFLAMLSLDYRGVETPEAEATLAGLEEWRDLLKRLAPLGRVTVAARPGSAGAAELELTAESLAP